MNRWNGRNRSPISRPCGRHRSARLLGLASGPVLSELFCVSNCGFFSIEITEGAIGRLRMKPDLCENHLGGEFALVGRAGRAIGLIAAQCKNRFHLSEYCPDCEIVARSARIIFWSNDLNRGDPLERSAR